MTEHPVLFSGPLVRAILAGRKTQTRRVMKLPNGADAPHEVEWGAKGSSWVATWEHDPISPTDHGGEPWSHDEEIRCPYGQPGDRLWVRESYRLPTGQADGARLDKMGPKAIGELAVEAGYSRPWCPTKYEADAHATAEYNAREWGGWGRYRSARFMPKWASLLTLEVTGIRVERVQEISATDAQAEGVFAGDERTSGVTLRSRFRVLWDSINGKRKGCSWADNPWVWVVEFKVAT